MNLQNLNIDTVSFLDEYYDLRMLRVEYNRLTDFDGLQNSSKLSYIIARNQYIKEDDETIYTLGINELTENRSKADAFSSIYLDSITGKNTNLYYLDVRNCSVKWVSYLSNCKGLKYLALTGCSTILDASTLGQVMISCGNKRIY